MNRTLGLTAIVVAALGIWSGVSAWQSAWVITTLWAALAIGMSITILFGIWVWYRAAPGSGDAMVMPWVIQNSAWWLVGFVLPRLFWPNAEWLHAVLAAVFAIVMTVLTVQQIRRWRTLRAAARPA